MLPGSEELDEPNKQPWFQAGGASAQAAFARSQEGERAATREDDVTLLVVKVPESQSRAFAGEVQATSCEAGNVCAEEARADLDAIANMASEGGPNC
jgi:hypothetical protein